MALRSRHGNSAGRGLGSVVEVTPLDEQGPGVQAPAQVEASDERRENGTIAKGAHTVPSMGGRANKNRQRLTADGAIAAAQADPAFRPYLGRGKAFTKAVVRHLARSVGGGECDPLACAIAAIAGDQLAASRFIMARAAVSLDPAEFTTAARLGDSARQNLIAARDVCEKQAAARRAATPSDPLAAVKARIASTAAAAKKEQP